MQKFHASVVFIILVNVKMSTMVAFLTFMSRINFSLSGVEHKKVEYPWG